MKKHIFIFFFLIAFHQCLTQNLPGYNVIRGEQEFSTGYYFINTMKPLSNNQNQYNIMVMDRFGSIVYIKNFNSTVIDFKLQPNGKITYSNSFSGNVNLKFLIMDSTFTISDSVRTIGFNTDSHDLVILPNGHYLIMGIETRIMNLTAYNWFNGNGSPGSANASVLCGVIQELDENKNVLFTWKSADHYQFSDVQEQWLFNPNLVDWTHFNSVEMDNDGNIIICLRHFSEITKINRLTGDIIWRMGGKSNQFTFINDPYNGFSGQHTARRNENGNLFLFDNGYLNAPIHPARGVEYSLNEQARTATMQWNLSFSNTSSLFLGSTERDANGNNIIGWGGLMNRNIMFSSHKPDGSLIMGINFPDTFYTYRVFNVPALPWKLNRPVITCMDSTGGHFLRAPEGYSSYKWSTGEVTRIIQITVPDTYFVFVPYGTGGFISSENVIITNLNNPCQQVEVEGNESLLPDSYSLYQNYPNPFNPVTTIQYSVAKSGNVKIIIYDIAGREITTLVNKHSPQGTFEIQWDAKDQSSGIYFYKIVTDEFTDIKKMVLVK